MRLLPSHLAAWLSLLLILGATILILVLVSSGANTTPRSQSAESTTPTLLVAEASQTQTSLSPLAPTATIALGMLGFCPPVTDWKGPLCTTNMWRGVVNGDLIQVMAGQEGVDGDMEQGIVIVTNLGNQDKQVYKTTQRAGPVRIVAVNGTVITFSVLPANWETPEVWLTPWTEATPDTTYALDLVSRQWISPPPSFTPVPTPTWGSGMLPCLGGPFGEGWYIQEVSCWEGDVDGYLVHLSTGREKNGGTGSTNDGYFEEYAFEPSDRTQINHELFHSLPQGVQSISSVNGTLVSLSSGDTFDLNWWLPIASPDPTP